MELYAALNSACAAAGVITVVVFEVPTASGSLLDTVQSSIWNLWRVAGLGLGLSVTGVIVWRSVGLVSRQLRQLPFKVRERNPRGFAQ